MSCCAGLNAYVGLAVPPNNVDGPLTGVANLTARKTIYLTGTFNGEYVVLGSHDNVDFVPIAKFNGNGNPQSAKKDIDATLNTVRVRRNADAAAIITIASQTTCACQETPPPPPQMALDEAGDKPAAKRGASKAAAAPAEAKSVTTKPAVPKPGAKGSPYAAAKPGAKRETVATEAPPAAKAGAKAAKKK